MDDPVVMGFIQSIGNLCRHAHDILFKQGAGRKGVRQRTTRDIFHDKVVHVLESFELVNGCDVRMIESG